MIFSKICLLALGAVAPLPALAAPGLEGICQLASNKGCDGNQVCRPPTDDRLLRLLRGPFGKTIGTCVDRRTRSDEDSDLVARESDKGCNPTDDEGCKDGEICVFDPFGRFNPTRMTPFTCVKDSKEKRQEDGDDEEKEVMAGDVCNPEFDNACGEKMTCVPDEKNEGVIGVCSSKNVEAEEKERRQLKGYLGKISKGSGDKTGLLRRQNSDDEENWAIWNKSDKSPDDLNERRRRRRCSCGDFPKSFRWSSRLGGRSEQASHQARQDVDFGDAEMDSALDERSSSRFNRKELKELARLLQG